MKIMELISQLEKYAHENPDIDITVNGSPVLFALKNKGLPHDCLEFDKSHSQIKKLKISDKDEFIDLVPFEVESLLKDNPHLEINYDLKDSHINSQRERIASALDEVYGVEKISAVSRLRKDIINYIQLEYNLEVPYFEESSLDKFLFVHFDTIFDSVQACTINKFLKCFTFEERTVKHSFFSKFFEKGNKVIILVHNCKKISHKILL